MAREKQTKPIQQMTIREWEAAFPNEEACDAYLVAHRWPHGITCPRCGSSVFARSGDEVELHLGALDAPDQLMPTYENWIVRRESWLPPFPLAHHCDRDRETTGRADE